MNLNFTINDNRSAEVWASKIGSLVQSFSSVTGNLQPTLQQNSGYQSSKEKGNSQCTRLEKLLTLQEESSTYCEENKDDEAYGLLNKQYKLGAEVSFIPVLINYYQALIKTDRSDETDNVLQDLMTLLRDRLKPHPNECESFANKYRADQEYVKALLFYKIAATLFIEKNDAKDILLGLQGCMLGTKICVKKLLKRFPSSHSYVVQNILPSMYEMKDQVQNVKGINRKAVSLTLAICMHHLENTLLYVGDLLGRQATLEESVSLMEKNWGGDTDKSHLYGAALNNLGASYLKNGRPQDAKDLFIKAISVNMEAEDYDTEAERTNDVKRTQSALQQAEDALNLVAR